MPNKHIDACTKKILLIISEGIFWIAFLYPWHDTWDWVIRHFVWQRLLDTAFVWSVEKLRQNLHKDLSLRVDYWLIDSSSGLAQTNWSVAINLFIDKCTRMKHPESWVFFKNGDIPYLMDWPDIFDYPAKPPLAQVRPYLLQPGGGIAACDTSWTGTSHTMWHSYTLNRHC